MDVIPEPIGFGLPLSKALALIGLITLYFVGVWLRNYVFPADASLSLKRQLAAAVPVGLITMGMYGKTALPPLFAATADISADVAIMIGYTIVFGMMSREALEKMLQSGLSSVTNRATRASDTGDGADSGNRAIGGP